MDYLYLNGLSVTDVMELVMSYDIVCQWSIHLWEHIVIVSLAHIQVR